MTLRLFAHLALALAVVALGSVLSLHAQLPGVPYNFTPDSTLNWMVGGTVNAVERAGNTLLVGGDFRALAPKKNLTGGFALLTTAHGRRTYHLPFVNGEVTAIAYGDGAWYVAGRFGRLGTREVGHIVRITNLGFVDPAFTARVVGSVRAMAFVDVPFQSRVLYVGGEFTEAGVGASLQPVSNLAAFHVPLFSGPSLQTTFAPAPNLPVDTLAYTPSPPGRLYAGGEFTTIGGATRTHLAALDPITGAATGWNPNANGRVLTVRPTANGATIFAGGEFDAIGPDSRGFAAAISASTGVATPWNPQANGRVRTLVIDVSIQSAGEIYAGGDFTMIGGLARQRLARLNATDGSAASTFDVAVNGPVHALASSGATLFVGGAFTSVGGSTRLHAASITLATGGVTSWNPSFNDTVRAIVLASVSLTPGEVAVGGDFDAFGAIARRNLAAISLETGEVLPWRPVPDGTVRDLDVRGATLYVAGDFTTIDQQDRRRLAAFGRPALQLLPWNPDADAAVYALDSRGGTVYAGGDFTAVGGQPRERIVALNATSGVPTSWAPAGGNGRVLTIQSTSTAVYAGGQFTHLGGIAVNHLTRLDAATGAADAIWNPNPGGEVRAIEVSSTTVFAGGAFASIGGQPRQNLAALDPVNGAASAWQPNPNGEVNAIDLDGTTLYTGGRFTLISPGRPSVRRRPRLVGLDTTLTGPDAVYVTSFAPRWIGEIQDVDFDDDGIVAAGNGRFDGEEDEPVSRVAFFPRLFNLPPARPADLALHLTPLGAIKNLNLRWSPPILGARPNRYLLEAGTTPGGTEITPGLDVGAGTGWAVTVPLGTYYLRLRARNAFGTSPPTAETVLRITTSCDTMPDAPADLVAAVSGSLVTLGWTPAGGGPITGYRVEAGLSPGSAEYLVAVNATESSYSVSVPPGVYYARVRALGACGDNGTSNEAQIVVGGAAAPPAAPFDPSATVNGSTVGITWTAPGGQTGYQLEAGTAPGLTNAAVLTLGNVTTFTAPGVPSGAYFVRIRARNAAGLGPASDEVLVIVP